jgi:hypothetical protein
MDQALSILPADYWRWWGGPFDPHAFSINAANMAIRKLR